MFQPSSFVALLRATCLVAASVSLLWTTTTLASAEHVALDSSELLRAVDLVAAAAPGAPPDLSISGRLLASHPSFADNTFTEAETLSCGDYPLAPLAPPVTRYCTATMKDSAGEAAYLLFYFFDQPGGFDTVHGMTTDTVSNSGALSKYVETLSTLRVQTASDDRAFNRICDAVNATEGTLYCDADLPNLVIEVRVTQDGSANSEARADDLMARAIGAWAAVVSR
jgi:hypothetical protein